MSHKTQPARRRTGFPRVGAPDARYNVRRHDKVTVSNPELNHRDKWNNLKCGFCLCHRAKTSIMRNLVDPVTGKYTAVLVPWCSEC